MTRRADIDLLFGLLALQNGLIEQGTLFSAFAKWARDGSRGMAEILVQEGALDARERALLEGLVEKHLERHGGDSGKSLAAMASMESVRGELEEIGDPELSASLPPAPGPTQKPAGDDPYRTIASYNLGASTSEGTRFRILRPHASGGLGQVYVAHDTELNREVALKEIKERYADDARHRTRFEFEAEITGGLEHPGIVPVYGLGAHSDGRPYYAMRLIRGVTLKEAIADFHAPEARDWNAGRRGLELRKILRRLLDVCNAVDYAHQRGVIHRDLKPSNVMLGKHGETLVVDWGLAKAVGRPVSSTLDDERTLAPEVASGSSETLRGSAIGTPGFMSPEQAAGELDRIGPPSDIYSLGATLYNILIGKPPFDDQDQGRLLRMVRVGNFMPPRKLDRSIEPALEAICLKAMELTPTRRYPSARAMADDIERWMADEPVSALSDPVSVRAARWVRRNRALASAIAVFLFVSATASSVGTLLINVQKSEAIRQRRLAESNLDRAREVVDDMYTQFAGQIEDVPRMDDYQRTLLEKARAFYENEALPQSGDPALRAAAAGTLLRLGYIQQKLGRLNEARAIVGRALAQYESLIRLDPAATKYRAGVAEARESLARIEVEARDFAAAGVQLREAIEQRKAVVKDSPTDPKSRLALGIAWRELGGVLLLSNQPGDSDSAYRNALWTLEAVFTEHPDDQNSAGALADALDGLGHLYTTENRDLESEVLRRRAVALRRAALISRKNDLKSRCDLAQGLNNLGVTLSRVGKIPEAEDILREAIDRSEPIMAEHPDLPKNREALTIALSHLASLLQAGGRTTDAVTFYRRALQILRAGSRDSLDSAMSQTRLAVLLYELGRAEHLQHQLDTADGHLREAMRVSEPLIQIQGKAIDDSILGLRAQAAFLLGQIARDRGKIEEAVAAFHVAEQIDETLLRKSPDDLQVRGRLGVVLVEGLGKTSRELGRETEALASYRRASEILDSMQRKDSTDFYNLACCLAQSFALGRIQSDATHPSTTTPSDADRAVEALRSSMEAGGCTYAEVQGDTDLKPLGNHPGFIAILRDLAFPTNPFGP